MLHGRVGLIQVLYLKNLMAKIPYKRAVRKQLEWLAVYFFMIVLAGLALYPVNTSRKELLFAALAILFGAMAFRGSRRLGKSVICPSCGADLYEVIQAARGKRISFRHCPACGESVEV
jgi:predicted RNA-binding Zn-ribbon protein involved in translation (DUF1610 family)